MKRIRLQPNSNQPALRQVAFSAGPRMKCLAIHNWNRGLGVDSIYSALRAHAGGRLLETTRYLALISGWPRAKKVSPDGLHALLKLPGQVKSIEGELDCCWNGTNTPMSFVINTAPKMLFVGVADDAQKVARFDQLVQDLARKAELGYGYVFSGNNATEAAFYAAGITYVPAGHSIKQIVSDANDRWFNELALSRGDGKHSKFRAVYELNVLNKRQLECQINSEEFFSVVSKKGWGNINRISDYNWLWSIGEENRTDAEEYLQSSSLVV